MKQLKELTKAEDQLMRILWKLGKGGIKDIIDQLPAPKPAYNTVATVFKVLKTKGFVDSETAGMALIYFPLIQEKDYKTFAFHKLLKNYFNDSPRSLMSFLVEDDDIDENTRKELAKIVKNLKNK